jgi:glucose/mannose-6-phosphate isomerase
MKMNDYINDFTNHLREAMEIGKTSTLNKSDKKFSNILICGLGGSGIGGTIVNDIVSPFFKHPNFSNKRL